MKEKFITGKVKLLTEWLRGFFALFIIIGTGVATLWVRKTFVIYDVEGNIIFNYNIDYYIFISGICFDIIILVIIFVINKKINNFIKKFNKS